MKLGEERFNRQSPLQYPYCPSESRLPESRTLIVRVQCVSIHMACRPDRRGRRRRRGSGGSAFAGPFPRRPQNLCRSACRDAVRTLLALWVARLSTGWTTTGPQTRRNPWWAIEASRIRCADTPGIWQPALWNCAPATRILPISILDCGPRWLLHVADPLIVGRSANASLAKSGKLSDWNINSYLVHKFFLIMFAD